MLAAGGGPAGGGVVSVVELPAVRCGGRNFLRPGDRCYVRAGGADRTGFPAKVRRIIDEPAGIAVEVVVARPHRRAGTIRTIPLARVQRRRPALE